ncbi:tyrosine-protein phosphatase [Ekhidna sp.]
MFFSRKRVELLSVDLHSHLIPNIDDGAQSLDQSTEMVKRFINSGFKKIITTPHIHPRYPNVPHIIIDGLEKLQKELFKQKLEIEVEAAAEYYVDETFVERVSNDETILSFGDRYVLVESSFINKPIFFESTMFDLISKGYRPVLAHPERYKFLEGRIDWLEELKSSGILLQVTLGSVGGYYGKEPQRIAKLLLKKGIVDFLGSDLHHIKHFEYLIKGLESKEVKSAIKNGQIKNEELL